MGQQLTHPSPLQSLIMRGLVVMRGSKGIVAAKSAVPLKESMLIILMVMGGAQTSLAYQAVQKRSDRVLASQGPQAVVDFFRNADANDLDVIVTMRDHRHDSDPRKYLNEYVNVRLSPVDDSARSPSTKNSYLYFRDYTPSTDAERQKGRSSGRKRQINITIHPHRTSIQLMYGSKGFDVHSIRLAESILAPVREFRSVSIVIDKKALGRPVRGKIDSGYRLRYGSANDPNPWTSEPILYDSTRSVDIFFEFKSTITEKEKLGQRGMERQLTGRYLEIPSREMQRKDAYIERCRDVRQGHKWSKFYLIIDNEGRIRGGRIRSMRISDPYKDQSRATE